MKKVSLEYLKKIKIFKRFEYKYIIDKKYTNLILKLLEKDYSLIEENNKNIFIYHSLYFDTNNLLMWNEHNSNKDFRQKIRIREYDDNSKYLEIKEKNKGQILKTRIPIQTYDINGEFNWIKNNLKYDIDIRNLNKSLDVKYKRISFIKNDKSERITIDFDIEYYNYKTDKSFKDLNDNLVIMEIKKIYENNNELENKLNELNIYNTKFSKYHYGIIKTS